MNEKLYRDWMSEKENEREIDNSIDSYRICYIFKRHSKGYMHATILFLLWWAGIKMASIFIGQRLFFVSNCETEIYNINGFLR